ncbi:uncharacterized protein EI90DRAFT_640062 [Cantharellus anzutake]|uniref:uncharacterized protein n=1 Tax=Cantharellus anzutake TaxID=1750568 RepID=UPI001904F112|nr:uncharacterized protein EI90DRAFT_640062 [Cantharellus anzutake]KAF8333198.1 hypothetical protein EI90DRAFT_640062 [Cantharellus anzutake]
MCLQKRYLPPAPFTSSVYLLARWEFRGLTFGPGHRCATFGAGLYAPVRYISCVNAHGPCLWSIAMRRRCVVNCPVGDLLATTTPWRRHALSTQRMSRFDSVMTRFELCSVWLPHCFGRTNELMDVGFPHCRWLVSFGASLAEFSLQPWSDRTPKHPEAFRSQLRRAPNRSHLNPSQFFWPP